MDQLPWMYNKLHYIQNIIALYSIHIRFKLKIGIVASGMLTLKLIKICSRFFFLLLFCWWSKSGRRDRSQTALLNLNVPVEWSITVSILISHGFNRRTRASSTEQNGCMHRDTWPPGWMKIRKFTINLIGTCDIWVNVCVNTVGRWNATYPVSRNWPNTMIQVWIGEFPSISIWTGEGEKNVLDFVGLTKLNSCSLMNTQFMSCQHRIEEADTPHFASCQKRRDKYREENTQHRKNIDRKLQFRRKRLCRWRKDNYATQKYINTRTKYTYWWRSMNWAWISDAIASR